MKLEREVSPEDPEREKIGKEVVRESIIGQEDHDQELTAEVEIDTIEDLVGTE
jgi:hypothetical protein